MRPVKSHKFAVLPSSVSCAAFRISNQDNSQFYLNLTHFFADRSLLPEIKLEIKLYFFAWEIKLKIPNQFLYWSEIKSVKILLLKTKTTTTHDKIFWYKFMSLNLDLFHESLPPKFYPRPLEYGVRGNCSFFLNIPKCFWRSACGHWGVLFKGSTKYFSWGREQYCVKINIAINVLSRSIRGPTIGDNSAAE